MGFKTVYKIQWAVEALFDPSFKNDTIDSIGACAGFNSKSQFYSAFKKHKGMTPYQFVKKHSNILNKTTGASPSSSKASVVHVIKKMTDSK